MTDVHRCYYTRGTTKTVDTSKLGKWGGLQLHEPDVPSDALDALAERAQLALAEARLSSLTDPDVFYLAREDYDLADSQGVTSLWGLAVLPAPSTVVALPPVPGLGSRGHAEQVVAAVDQAVAAFRAAHGVPPRRAWVTRRDHLSLLAAGLWPETPVGVIPGRAAFVPAADTTIEEAVSA